MGGNDRGTALYNVGISRNNFMIFNTNAKALNMKERCERLHAAWSRVDEESGKAPKLLFVGMKNIENHRLVQIEYKFDYHEEEGGQPDLPYLLNIVNDYAQSQ